MKQRWQDVLVTDERLDRVYRGCDRWTRIMAWVAVIGVLTIIVIPALWSLVMQPTEKPVKQHGTLIIDDRGPVLQKLTEEALRR